MNYVQLKGCKEEECTNMQNSGTSAMVNPSSKQKESFFFQQLWSTCCV